MAAEVNARYNKHPTIAFTLPISCQVCLGKVKSPVLCPNNHVFCSTCLDVWLQKNKHCPACRVSMTSPKKIMGGISHQESETDKLTNPELRKARFDLLYKEYENEFERMQSEIHLLRTENQILKQQSRKDGISENRSSHGESSKNSEQLLVLTKKLQDATKLYEKMKGELTRVKQENGNLKDENVSLNRENQNLRQELAGRSPHRYGRITVQTLESKLASAEKDVTRLTKALERSDKYIEELEKERDELGGSAGPMSSASKGSSYAMNGDILSRKPAFDGTKGDNASRQLFPEDKGGKSSSGSTYGLSSAASSSSSYSSSSYLPTTLTSVTSVPSYSTAHSVPFTYTSTSYTSSGPANSYTSKPLDPIVESSNHYSYVSNASGDFPSKNDTFALPEPKKRLFDNSEDLDMSVSPIKSNRRF